jgi:type IV pilus assembly protein PilY1
VLPSSDPIANEYSNGGYGQLNATPITYRLKITQNGLLTLSYSYNGGSWKGVIQNEPISAVNSGALPTSVRFGFAGSTGGSSNIHEIMCFKASPATAGASSTTGNEKESSKVDAGTQVYFGSYDPTDWTGSLAAYGLITNSSGQVTGIATAANWDASCVLTGLAGSSNTCATTGVTGPVAAESPSSRTMLTWSGSGGTPFEWANLSSAEQTALNAIDGDGHARLSFLRGDRTNEIPNGSNLFRARDSVLADIVDSSPAWVGPPSQSLYFTYETPTAWVDRLNTSATMPENSGQSYTSYATAEQTRQNVVYVGANDGLLHGFASGSYNTDSSYDSSGNNGTEVLAYVPEEVLLGIHPTVTTTSTVTNHATHITTTTTTTAINSTLDFSNPQYGHNFYVDAPPGSGDLFYGGTWHTWVVGGLGAGLSGPWTAQASCGGSSMPSCATAWSSTTTYGFGSTASVNGVNYVANWSNLNESPSSDVAVGQGEIYALDVTTPSGFAESSAATLAKGDWIGGTSATTNPGSFTCSNVTNCALNLGFTYGTPEIRRLHDGNWAIIFGNGIGSSTGDAGIFILTINPTSNAQTMYYLSSGVKSGNGIAYVSAVDMDHDHVADYVYAGDLKGNVWRFDLTSSSESNWKVSTGPVFKTPSGQPITSQIVPEFVTVNGGTQMMLYFGTGEKFPQTSTSTTYYSGAAQAFYAVWDWNMSGWNALHSSQFTTLTTTQVATIAGLSSPYTLGTANLSSRAITVDGSGNRLVSTTATVCWANSTTCTTGNTKFGWYLNLPGTNSGYGTTTYEQIVFSPLILSTVVIFNSILPAIDSPLQCTTGLDNGWSYALDVRTGDTISGFWQGYSSTLPSNTAGYEGNATGTMYYAGGAVIYQDTAGQHHAVPVPLPPDISGGRETWVQIR